MDSFFIVLIVCIFVAFIVGSILCFLVMAKNADKLIQFLKKLSTDTLNTKIKDYDDYIILINQLDISYTVGQQNDLLLSSLNQVCASTIMSISTGKLEYGSEVLFQRLQIILLLYNQIQLNLEGKSFGMTVSRNVMNVMNKIKKSFFSELFQLYTSNLIQNYKEPHVRSTSLQVIQMLRPFVDQALSQHAYNNILDLLSSNPADKDLKTLALDFGRYYYSSLRPDGVITIYDEQAIQNDISVRMEH